jgi:cytochrome c556
MMKATVALAALSAAMFVATTAVAQQDPIESRQNLMKRSGQQLGAVNRMVRGQDPFDPAKVNTAFDAFADKAQKLPALFPRGSDQGTRALAKIWDDPNAWSAEIAKFSKNVADYRPKAAAGVEGLKDAVSAILPNCNSCHETFRRPAQR